MIRKFYKIVKKLLASKIIVSSPNSDLLIFDGTRFKEIKKYLFENEKCFILENRYENIREIYLSPKII